ncbi:arginine ABC transporter permease ArtQ [Frischella perrara]|jgi:ABC-type arginine transport system, permease component|uniref:Arginine ABC transporter permease ArtQ n=1 Tax=Frischella perrara TaxID=1267021 RepID=A0A318MTE3_FRIPE|nr:arginine ABC transporter permease ArtQ [Frischella perrara]MCT6876192.1 arginine ABC transporter permease ArtQ [Frischella perrara]PXY95199.1 arginine ABC transporter permease ArtQ [Frischella perrara]
MQDWHTLLPLFDATKITLFIAISALLIGIVLAFIITILESWRFKPIAWFVSLCVIAIRALPEMLIVIAIYNGAPLVLIFINDTILNGGLDVTIPLFFTNLSLHLEITDFDVNPILCGIIALSILYAVYASQTLRGAFKAIPNGQKQAAQVLGLSKFRTFTRIIMPQMWRHALPGLGNQWLVLLKDTALVSLITVNDIMMQTRSIIGYTREPFTWYLIAAIIYLVISLFSQRVLKYFETRSLYFEQSQSVNEK